MTKIINAFYETEHRFDVAAERFCAHHPYIGCMTAFIVIPISILGAVTISTIVVMLPLSLLFGWL